MLSHLLRIEPKVRFMAIIFVAGRASRPRTARPTGCRAGSRKRSARTSRGFSRRTRGYARSSRTGRRVLRGTGFSSWSWLSASGRRNGRSCGSESRSDYHQWLVFAALVGGMAFVGWRVVAGARRGRPAEDAKATEDAHR